MTLIDSFIPQRKAQGPSRTCNESKGERNKKVVGLEQFDVRKKRSNMEAGKTATSLLTINFICFFFITRGPARASSSLLLYYSRA